MDDTKSLGNKLRRRDVQSKTPKCEQLWFQIMEENVAQLQNRCADFTSDMKGSRYKRKKNLTQNIDAFVAANQDTLTSPPNNVSLT